MESDLRGLAGDKTAKARKVGELVAERAKKAGIDAVVREDGRRLVADSLLTSFSVDIQLKATCLTPAEHDGGFSYSLPVPQYDRLRGTRVLTPRLLVVLYLPDREEDWLVHREESLVAKRCAYWVSLRGAPESGNPKYQTISIPRRQVFSVDALTELMTRFSRREEVRYETRPPRDGAGPASYPPGA